MSLTTNTIYPQYPTRDPAVVGIYRRHVVLRAQSRCPVLNVVSHQSEYFYNLSFKLCRFISKRSDLRLT